MDLAPQMKVPGDVAKIVLPNPELSVASFLNLPLPVPHTASFSGSISSFFDNAEITTINIKSIWDSDLPPAGVMEKLLEEAPLQYSKGKRSILYAHLESSPSCQFPFWILTYWTTMHKI